MNYLAHLYLSQDNGLSMAGNLMADFLKHVEVATVEKTLQAISDRIRFENALD